MSEHRTLSYEFGPFSLDAGKRLLLRNGEPVQLAPKVLETLLALIENRERVVTKDELLRQIWGDTIVEEGGLTRNVSVLRRTLGKSPTSISSSSPCPPADTSSSRRCAKDTPWRIIGRTGNSGS